MRSHWSLSSYGEGAPPVRTSAAPSPAGFSPWTEYNVLVSPCETSGKGVVGANVGMARNANKGPVGVFEVSQTGWQDLNVLSSEC